MVIQTLVTPEAAVPAAPAPEAAATPPVEVAEQGVPAPPTPETAVPAAPEAAVPAAPAPDATAAPVAPEGELPPAPEGEMEGEEMEIDVEEKPKEKKVSDLKRIQILVGKLAQKIRSYNEEKELSAENVKYVINSILSALDVDVLDEDDLEEIISKLEGGDEEEGGEEDFEMEDEEISGEEMGDEEMVPPPPAPEEAQPEMAEGYDSFNDAFNDYLPSAFANIAMRGMSGEKTESSRHYYNNEDEEDLDIIDFDEVEEDDYHRERRRGRKNYPDVDRFEHGTFSESVVDGVLSKYFIGSDTEVKDFKIKQERRTNENYKKNKENIIKLSESTEQLDAALDFIRENPRTHLIGISNKKTLIFKNGINEVRITDDGFII